VVSTPMQQLPRLIVRRVRDRLIVISSPSMVGESRLLADELSESCDRPVEPALKQGTLRDDLFPKYQGTFSLYCDDFQWVSKISEKLPSARADLPDVPVPWSIEQCVFFDVLTRSTPEDIV